VLFGAHPYAQVSPSEEQVAAYKRVDLQSVYREIYTPENALLMLVGDFDPPALLKTVERCLEIGREEACRERGGDAAETTRAPGVSGAQSGIGADANPGGVPCDHAEASGLVAPGADEQLVWRGVNSRL